MYLVSEIIVENVCLAYGVYVFSLTIRSKVILKQLSIGVASDDTSYMPQLITLSVGNSPTLLRHIKEVRIAR